MAASAMRPPLLASLGLASGDPPKQHLRMRLIYLSRWSNR
jgi:hypothetical protein